MHDLFDPCVSIFSFQMDFYAVSRYLPTLIGQDGRFQRSADLTCRRFILPHTEIRLYYLVKRVMFQVGGFAATPVDPPADMLLVHQAITDADYLGRSVDGLFSTEGSYNFHRDHTLMIPIGGCFDGLAPPASSAAADQTSS